MELEIGAILDGKVSGITKFGAFVSLPGGRSGLVHISEVAYAYVSEVSDFLTVGQEVRVKVINIDANNRINLSIKQVQPPPARTERPARGERPAARGDRASGRGGRRGGENRTGERPRGSSGSKEPPSFEDMMKQYMSESENKLSQLHRGERSNRRGGRRRG